MKKIYGTTLFLGDTVLETLYGEFKSLVFQDLITKWYVIALIYSETNLDDENLHLYTRIHSSCVTSEMLNSQDCDCVEQLNGAFKKISEMKKGILFYLIQEGRGCGYIGKARGCQLVQYHECNHNHEMTTFKAYESLGMKMDYRSYHNIKEILQMLSIYEKAEFTLLTNNPDKINGLKNLGVKIINTESIEFIPNPFNKSYLKSKQIYGHKLNKITKKNNIYNIPFKPFPPFKPYHVKDKQRFIRIASYFIPIKPINNNLVLSDDVIGNLIENNEDIKSDPNINNNNIVIINNNIKNKYNLIDPYWFSVNLYYDISTNLDYIVLMYVNPYNKEFIKNPVVRLHSESIFDRFPLKKRLYKKRYENSILNIVKNGYGYLLLFYRDGRGSGLGYYLLNQKFSNNNIGIKKNTRDYHAAMQLLKEFIKSPIKMIYSKQSKNDVEKHLQIYNYEVKEWIDVDSTDNSSINSIEKRIININSIFNLKNINKLTIRKYNKYIVTGIGTSIYHAKYFSILLKNKYDVDSIFKPIISFNEIKKDDSVLVIFSQGLSNNTHIAFKKWNYKNIILFTSVNLKTKDFSKDLFLKN